MVPPFMKFLQLCFFCLIPLSGISQTIAVETQFFNEETDLSRYANFIHKDSRGLIWVGTQYGLYRFDGTRFTHFNENVGLPFRQIMEIYEDSEGWFWLYKNCHNKPNCEKDLAFFHPLTREVLTFEQRFGEKVSVRANQIQSLVQDAQNIYFTADHKFLIWSGKKGIQEIPLRGLSSTPFLFSKVNDNLFGALLMDDFKDTGLHNPDISIKYLAFDLMGNLKQAPKALPKIGFTPKNLFEISRKAFEFDRLRVGSFEINIDANGGLNIEKLPFSMPLLKGSSPYFDYDEQLYANENGEIFDVALNKKVELTSSVRSGNGLFSVFWVKNKGKDSFFRQLNVNNGVRHYYFDEETNMLWSAIAGGVKVFHFKKQFFHQVYNKTGGNNLGEAVFFFDDDKVLLKTVATLFLNNQQGNHTDFYPDYPFRGEKDNLSTFCQERTDDDFWGMGWYGHLYKISKRDLSFIKYPRPKEIQKVRALIKDGNQLWIGTTGLYLFDIDQGVFAEYDQYNQFTELQSANIHYFKREGKDKLWICSDAGLYLCSKENGVLARYNAFEEAPFYLPAQNIFHISDAKDGGYWLATMNGLIHLTESSHGTSQTVPTFEWKNHTDKDGLQTNEILAAYEDDYGFVWMPTPHGLIQLQINSGLSKIYLKKDGLSNSGFQEYAHGRAKDGTLYFGGYVGFNIFHPKDFKDVDWNPEVELIITDFEQHKDETDKIEFQLKQIVEEGEIVLQPGDKFFNIRVALADYRGAGKHQFTYKIEGFSEEWHESRSNWIRISGLPYGDFTLKIKGRLPDGQFAAPGLSIPVKVIPPFYKTLWFNMLWVLSLLVAGPLFYKWRISNLQKKQLELEKVVSERTETIRLQNEELKNLDQVKSRFFANVSHELRTPVTLILGPLASILKGRRLNDKDNSLAELSHKNAKSLLTLINEILDLTKMESGKIELKEEAVGFYVLMQRLIGAFEGIAEQKSIQYQFNYQVKESLYLKLDKNKFEKLFNNLLSNAFKFSGQHGYVIVKVEESKNNIVISVQDSGRGIHPQDLPHIFERFYQSKLPNAPKEGGTGIGLSLSMEFAKLMKGKLWVESTFGKGSTFYFEFPKKEIFRDDDLAAIQVESFTKNQIALSKKEISSKAIPFALYSKPSSDQNLPFNLLLVEDNQNLREYIKLIIGDRYIVNTAENGKVAWEILNGSNKQNATLHGKPDLIISDIMMPEMDGYQLLQKLKGDDRFRSIPVIMLTALADLKDKLKSLRIGVDDYLTKPFEEEELKARISNLLKNSQERKNLHFQEGKVLTEERAGDIKFKKSKNKNDDAVASLKSPSPRRVTEADAQWLEKVEKNILENIGDFRFSIEQLASQMAMSRVHLYRRLKQMTGLSATEYLNEVRYCRARQILEEESPGAVKVVALEVGLKDFANFSRQFKKRYGKLPSEYL